MKKGNSVYFLEPFPKKDDSAETYREVAEELRLTRDLCIKDICESASDSTHKDIMDMLMNVIDACERKATRLEGG